VALTPFDGNVVDTLSSESEYNTIHTTWGTETPPGTSQQANCGSWEILLDLFRAGHTFTRAGGADNLDNEKLLEDLEGGVCHAATPCGSQAYPYLLYLQVILWLVEGSRWRSTLPEAKLKDKFRGGPTL
jgi:hypothetical protein